MALPGAPSTPLTIKELQHYTQLSPGDTGYINPDLVFVPVGSNSFTAKAMYIRLTELINFGASASESDRITGLTEHEYTKTFAAPYLTLPVATKLEVYRMYNIPGTTEWIKEEVSYYFPTENWLTLTGFTIVIRAEESLTGIIIEYKFN